MKVGSGAADSNDGDGYAVINIVVTSSGSNSGLNYCDKP